jgi:gluconolactonase
MLPENAESHSAVPWQPSQRYPDPAVQIIDQSFAKYRVTLASVERIAHGFRWSEGPVWFGDGRYLLWSDIPNNRIMKWEEETGAVSVYRKPSNFANGNTRDRQGRLITCEHGGRRVIRTEYDGTITVIADRFEGKRLNSPNDVVVKSDNSIWFTDPPFGLLGYYEGYLAEQELPTNVYRVDGTTGEMSIVEQSVNRPNGLCFSPDESRLYLVESGPPRNLFVYDVVDDGKRITNKRKHFDCGAGTPDGMRCDIDGNLWLGWGMGDASVDGVNIHNPDGRLIGRIALPERCANLCFGGTYRNRLFMAASKSVYALYVNAQGARGG